MDWRRLYRLNKIIIPVALIAIIAIGAGFAFAPVDQATTVNDQIEDQISDNVCVAIINNNWEWDGEECAPIGEV